MNGFFTILKVPSMYQRFALDNRLAWYKIHGYLKQLVHC